MWNTPRQGFAGSPVKVGMEENVQDQQPSQLKATFLNSGTNPAFETAELYYDESGYWGKIGHGEGPLVAYTYRGHKVRLQSAKYCRTKFSVSCFNSGQWNIKVGDKFVKQFVIGSDEIQEFTI